MVGCPDLVSGVVIVGAGPSGLAVAACLKELGVPYIIIEKSDSIASLWKKRTYVRLKLILPKKSCKLPKLSIPENFPEFLTKYDFISYLENYAKEFDIKPRFNECVKFAEYHEFCKVWRVVTSKTEYWCQMLVVATGENAEPVVPKIDGLDGFLGEVIHSKDYDSGKKYEGKNVLVVGCGNSGCDVSLDLASHNANPFMVVRNSDHELPPTIKGKSTDDLFMMLMKKPNFSPLKNYQGKIPVLDDNIREVEINIFPGIKRFNSTSVELVNDKTLDIDYVILATGYRSNVPYWLKETGFFAKNGFPITPFPNGWKGKHGLFAAGFTRRGLVGLSSDAKRICKDAREEFDDELMWNIYCEECSLGIR